ncbi:hypothetical protein BS329_35275 [Amycolatopsis coloradensis]|uniref:Uncharacterized protein n=1 Tax=Amycolatopsis coloradensis TaxID=76021 RepID=A0A1R0KH59_9PSEU|nr:type I polyketide synthase [Amycolatopsis coloradensis]OLZ45014.1 hypothetical protein BS329_35275 [Amycolatopsis coloradensis]
MSDEDEAVAIIGLACRFPGAANAGEFWRNLLSGKETISRFGRDELLASGVPAARVADPAFVAAGGVVDDIDEFDAAYFGVPPREAELMDPQHRLFLQCVVTALEDAGTRPGGDIGVYAAAGFNSYLTHRLLPAADRLGDVADVQWLAGGEKDYLATRASYKLGLTGPSMSVQTACSSALVAVHLAVESLLSGECSAAVAGAVSIGVLTGEGYLHHEGGILSADGHCRPFDESATGTVFGGGVGAVVLKRLADARADGDDIRAVLLGSAINNDGGHKVGYTAPGLEGQVRVIGAAHAVAGVTADEVSYVEGHGTGTVLGDRIELAALRRVFADWSGGECGLGSVKSNVGHLDTAAGMAGLIKTVLCLRHRTLAPTVGSTRHDGPFRVSPDARPWEPRQGRRLAGVSSFGIGGTNAHLVLAEAPGRGPLPAVGWQVLPLSARTTTALNTLTRSFAATDLDTADIADVAHTLQTGRTAHAERRFVVARSMPEARAALSEPGIARNASAPTGPVFLFPGQGTAIGGTVARMYRSEPVFRAELDACLEVFGPEVRELTLHGGPGGTEVVQPALFAVELALARWWTGLGVRPAALVGHSVGEYAAACLAGVFSLPDAARLVTARGRLMAAMPPGAMLSVPLREDEVAGLLSHDVEIASVNAPDRVVLAGPREAIEAVRARLDVPTRLLDTAHAFHTRQVEAVLSGFTELIAATPCRAPVIPIASTLTGDWLTTPTPAYWLAQARRTVRFADAVRTAASAHPGQLLEAGPGRALSVFARRTIEGARSFLPGLGPDDRPPTWLTGLGELWAAGHEVDWARVGEERERRKVALPTYPFARDRHWIDSRERRGSGSPELLHQRSWRRTARPRGRLAPGIAFVSGVGEDLVRSLREEGYDVRQGAIGDLDAAPDLVVHGALTRAAELGVASAETLAAQAEQAVAEPAFLGRELASAFPGAPITMVVLTAGALGESPVRPQTAAALGPVRVLPAEYMSLRCRLVDALGVAPEPLCAEVLADPAEPVVVVRANGRWVPETSRLPAGEAQDMPAVRDGGTYLITGGLGAIGLAAASAFAARCRCTLVLVSRNAVAGPEVEALRRKGATVRVEAVDVTDRRALAALVASVGRIDGMVQAAGVAGGGLVHGTTGAEVGRVLAPKVLGALLLHELTKDSPPDFVLYCSSVLALTGRPGQVAYTGANAVLDSLAHVVPGAVAIAWDRWAEAGMAVRGEVLPAPDGEPEPSAHPLFSSRRRGTDAVAHRVAWTADTRWFLDEHQVAGTPVVPGMAMLELVIAARAEPVVELRDVVFKAPATDTPELDVVLRQDAWEIRAAGQVCVTGRAIASTASTVSGSDPARVDLAGVRGRCAPAVAGPVEQSGPVKWGPRWDCVTDAWAGDGETLVRLELAERYQDDLTVHPLHPALLDVATSTLAAGHVPVACARLVVRHALPAEVHSWSRLRHGDGDTLVVDVTVADADGMVLAELEGFTLRRPGVRTGIATVEGVAALWRVLEHRHLPHLVVSPGNKAAENTGTVVRPDGDVEDVLAQMWQRMLGVEVGRNQTIFELGGDSLLIVEIAAQARQLGLAVSPGDVFAHPTVAELAAVLRETEEAPPEVPRKEFSVAELDAREMDVLVGMFTAQGEREQ